MKKTSTYEITENYARALLEAAKRENALKKTIKEAQILSQALENQPQFKQLSNPGWKPTLKKELMALIADKLGLSRPLGNLLEITVENHRQNYLKEILSRFCHLAYAEESIAEITLESACKLSPAQKKEFETGLQNILKQKIIVTYVIRPEVLGGLIVRWGSVRIDDSLAGKLDRLEQIMKGKL